MLNLARLKGFVHLVRWLGPTGDPNRKPRVMEEDLWLDDGQGGRLRVKLYRPAEASPFAPLLLIPGVHYEAADDQRFDRFAAILARAGFFVWTPYLNDFLKLRITPRVLEEAGLAFRALLAHPQRPPGKIGILSISFGSWPALRLGSDERYATDIGGILTFGGYAQWDVAFRFAMEGGGPGRPYDPLNRPVVFLNLQPLLPPTLLCRTGPQRDVGGASG